MHAVRSLADYVHAAQGREPTAEAGEAAIRCIFDLVSAVVVGLDAADVPGVRRIAQDTFGGTFGGGSTPIWFARMATGMVGAAWSNSAAASALDLDDGNRLARGHPGAAVIPAAFALSRMRFWGSTMLATGIFLTYLIPETLLFIPLFKMFALVNEYTGIQLLNRWWVLLLVYPTLTVPFCTWIMIGYFASIPKELDEAAIIDGASWFQTLTRIFIPVALPGLIAATIFAFTVSWAQFLYPLVFTTSTDQLVLPVGIITTLIKGDVFNWGQIMTGALLGAAPPLIIYAFLMDYYIAGLTAGATKG